jgi:hypothetical protein
MIGDERHADREQACHEEQVGPPGACDVVEHRLERPDVDPAQESFVGEPPENHAFFGWVA